MTICRKTTLRTSLRAGAWALVAALAACGGGGEISGTITGLTTDGLVLSDGAESIDLAAGATTFSFPTVLADKTSYAVTVVTQPTGLRCSVTNGTGIVSTATAAVSDVVVSCVAVYSLSGTISGLTGSGLVLSDGFEDIDVAAKAPSFAFPTALVTGANYAVTVTTQPAGQTCSVTNGTGTVASTAVANVAVSCR